MLTQISNRHLVIYVNELIIPKVNQLREYQDPKGPITTNARHAEELLLSLVHDVKKIYKLVNLESVGEAFEKDIHAWIQRGLSTKPHFDQSLSAYRPPLNNERTFFIAPMQTPNGPTDKGYYFEAFLAVRDEPKFMEKIEEKLPHPKNGCQSLKILSGTKGFMEGKCIVFFPENVSVSEAVTSQKFAIFFFNKFYKIYYKDTLKRASTFFKNYPFQSKAMTESQVYEARVLWGYLHDYFHHCGVKPFDQHIQAKMNFFAGILEEVKVDCQSVLLLHKNKYPFADQIIEFVLFERLLRYPSQIDATKNFDSGTGFFLLSWLFKNGTSIQKNNDFLSLDIKACLKDLEKLVHEIETLEQLNDDEYKAAAENYARTYLPDSGNQDRFKIPDAYFIYDENLKLNINDLTFYELGNSQSLGV